MRRLLSAQRLAKTHSLMNADEVRERKRAQQMCEMFSPRAPQVRAEQANSSTPSPRGDKWEQRVLIRCSARVIGSVQQTVTSQESATHRWLISSHSSILGHYHSKLECPKEDMRVDRRRRRGEKTQQEVLSLYFSSNLSCHLVKSESYGVRASDIIRVRGRGGGTLMCVCVSV